MKAIEYKLNKVNGASIHPDWVEFTGFFFDGATKTYVGVVLDESDRDYYVPDTVVELTQEDIATRCGDATQADAWWKQFILRIKE